MKEKEKVKNGRRQERRGESSISGSPPRDLAMGSSFGSDKELQRGRNLSFLPWKVLGECRDSILCFGKGRISLLDGNGNVKWVLALIISFVFSWSNLNSNELRDSILVCPNLGILDRNAWFHPKSTESESEYLQAACSVRIPYRTEINREFRPNRTDFDNYA